MNEKNFISYDIFCQRKKFSLENYIKINPDVDYGQFRNIFLERKVMPPSEALFLEVKSNILIEEKTNSKDLTAQETEKPIADLPKKTRKTSRKRRNKNEQA